MIPEYFVNVPLHWHSEFEINYILKGHSEFICGEERFRSQEGDIIIICPNTLHAIYALGEYEQQYDTLVFRSEMLGAAEEDRCAAECIRPIVNGSHGIKVRIAKDARGYADIEASVKKIFFCVKGNTPQLDLLLKSELMKLFWLLDENGYIFSADCEKNSREELIRPAIEYINRHFREPIGIEELSELLHFSKSYFMSCFKQAAGVGAIEYIIQLRIKAVCELLTDTDETAANAAFRCGFENLSNFNRQFKKRVGCTPVEYRKLSRRRK